MAIPGSAKAQPQSRLSGADPTPQPAIPAILAAFDKYEVVAMMAAHDRKDLDDFILALLRTPAFPDKVNDIEVECGNSLYQPILDRYIAGEDVAYAEVRKVWRNTTQRMCGESGFYEQLFPLVRAINQKLPAARRLRVLAGDPPIDWDQVKTFKDVMRFFNREASIASVMENEVLSKHRKALMLFGILHLLHGQPMDAVSIYEEKYPHVTFVIGDLTEMPNPPDTLAGWTIPSLAVAKGTWLGAKDYGYFYQAPIRLDMDCKVHNDLPEELQKPMEKLVDAFLYLGPQNLLLKEAMPADIALDSDYRTELKRRQDLGFLGSVPQTLKEEDEEIVNDAGSPLLGSIELPDVSKAEQTCLGRKKSGDKTKIRF